MLCAQVGREDSNASTSCSYDCEVPIATDFDKAGKSACELCFEIAEFRVEGPCFASELARRIFDPGAQGLVRRGLWRRAVEGATHLQHVRQTCMKTLLGPGEAFDHATSSFGRSAAAGSE